MTVKISIYDHVFKNAEPEIVEYSSVAEWILDNKKRLVNFAVFNGQPSLETDITKDVNALMSDTSEYVVLISPCGGAASYFLFGVVGGYSINYLIDKITPKLPLTANNTQQSANNALSGRTNEPRVLQRIEDIYGTVRSYPSLLQPVYSKYIDNVQYEYSYMCVGRGWYAVEDVKDGETLVSDITGSKAEFYNPFTSPNSGSPFLTIGGAIGETVKTVKKSNNVNGEVLQARNQFVLTSFSDNMQFFKAADLSATHDCIFKITEEFYNNVEAGNVISVSGTGTYDGSYTIESKVIYGGIFRFFELTTATWSTSTVTPIAATLTITTGNPEWSDWVTLTDTEMWQFWVNLIAQQGLYYQDSNGSYNLTVNYEIQYQKVVSGTPTGSVYTSSGSLTSNKPDQVAKTIEITTGWLGATRVRVRRSNDHDFGFSGNVVDEIKYESLSAVTLITNSDFGNVTTVQVITKATQRALSLKERKFNALVTRKLPTYNGTSWSGVLDSDGSILSGTINATTSFVNILAAITQDPFIGRQSLTTIDLAQIYALYSQIGGYFGLGTEPMAFHYTLDSDNISYEETIRMIANAVFCIAYRQNGKIRFTFDKPQTSSTALFTHRNKKPSSDVISRRFTADAEYDGIELTYNDNVTDAQEVIKLPLSGLATNYKKIELTGVREYEVAYIRAAREYNKLKYQRISIETETTMDGRLLLPNQRIDIVDNTRFDSQDGEVIAQSGLTLTLSRNLVWGVGTHSILLMKRDGSLESIGCTAGTSANQVVLDTTPSEAINTTHGGANGVRTIFSFGADSVSSANSYLVQEVNISDKSYVKVSAINYDANYYSDDLETIPNREDVFMTQITVADLNNAKLDVDTIADIANSTAETVTDRLGAKRRTIYSLSNEYPNASYNAAAAAANALATAADRVQTGLDLVGVQAAVSVGVGSLAVQTLAALNAITTAATNSIGYVTNDGTSTNNGVYQWNGTVWTKSIYDPLTQAKVYADERDEGVKNFVAQKLYVSLNNDLHQFADVEGNIVARIDQDGMFHVIGLENSIQLQFAEQKNELLGVVDSTVTLVQKSLNILTDQPDLYLFTDADGSIVARISHDGQLHVVGLNQPVQVEFVTLNEKVSTVTESVNRQNYGTDDLYLVVDLDGNIVARIKEDGRYYIVGLANDIATEFASVRDEIDKKAESIKDTSVAEIRSYKDTVTPQVQTVLNTLMYAQTGAKAPPPLHYFKQNYTIDSAWINNINQFGHSNSTRLSIATPYRTDDGVVHPHILEFYNGFRGYRYIICITPYYLTNEAYENPCIYGSNDLINLTLLDGFTQPLDNRPLPQYSTGHNSDNTLAYDPKTGELICIWRQSLRNSDGAGTRTDALWMRKTKDGYNWTDKQRIFLSTKNTQAGGAGSPAIVYDVASGYWYMYLTTLSTTTDAMRLFKAKNLDENAWEYVATLTLPFKPWHQDIKIVGNKVCMLVYCYPPDNTIYFGIADDFTNFTWTQNLMLENNAYKASFVPEFNTNNEISLKILYSTDSSPSSNAEKWRMYMHQTNFINANLGVTL